MADRSTEAVIFSDLGERGLMCAHAPGPLALTRQRRIWAVAAALKDKSGVLETIPGMNNLVVLFDPGVCDAQRMRAQIEALWQIRPDDDVAGRTIDIPVIYGGDAGPDLPDLAARANLSIERFVELHSGAEYTVYALGSQPGFGYLGGLPDELATPRRTVIHPSVKAGSVIIGGAQTAVQSRTTPSGWHMIGFADVECFNVNSNPPTLLMPGDRVRFRVKEVRS